MTTTDVPTREQLVRRASELVPVLRENSDWSEDNRRIHDDSIEALADAGIFRMRAPARFGGFESDTRTLVEVAAELGRADASTGWIASVYSIPTWMAGLFPDHVQDEVFSTPDVRVCGTLSPTAMAAPVDGGIVVNGKWGFISGALHAHWQVIVAVRIAPDSEPMPVMALVPVADLQIIDDWHTSGLKGTGSVSTVADNVFVPADRVLPLGVIVQGQGGASQANADAPMYRAPLLPVASASSVGAVLGMAHAAKEAFLARLPERKITYTNYASQAEAPLTHLQVAEAALKIDQAEFHAFRLADLVDAKNATGEQWTLEERVRARADMGAVCSLAKEAVDIFATASGGSSIYSSAPIQRISRDVQAVNLHALMHPDTNAELYGRVLCGLEPNSLYI
ncbi:acyl-CoA dehydrogenase family protein [Streptomyces goshikiensis]|uniref:acyl-CoA dehydrogenase family protein n=1 Tax=Streptomyces goshikiensis TaxID=1942 RepID=UPI00332B141E